MKLSPLQKKLVPGIEDLSMADMEATFYPITEDYIRSTLIKSERLSERILTIALAAWDIDYTQPAPQFEKEHILQSIVDVPYTKVVTGLGIIANINLLAHDLIRSDRDQSVIQDLPAEDLRVALSLRQHAPDTPRTIIDHTSLMADGKLCFELWLEDVPEQIRNLLNYAYSEQSAQYQNDIQYDVNHKSMMKSAADVWLTNWIERQPQEQANEVKNSEESAVEPA